ncbi:hypothetical protein C8J57DRAFT_1149001 [Mycena rebaudengoi]|nr:hypothetical protein C8J57DRAFT_1149001 [Mycena rebaudengoi]
MIQDLLVDPCKQVAELTGQIERLQELLVELARKRDVLNGFIDGHLALVSPARRLPDDIVRGIFVAFLPSNEFRNCTIYSMESPILICQICRAWRSLALSTPGLWNSLHIAVPDYTRLSAMVIMVDGWLSRSGALPLSISLALSNAAEPGSDLSAMFETLRSYSPRWKHLWFILLSLSSLVPLSILSRSDVPMLESVCIHEDGWSDGEGALPELPFLHVPRLTLPPRFILEAHSIQWENLHHLDIVSRQGAHISSRQALDILRQCLRLDLFSLPRTNGVCRLWHLKGHVICSICRNLLSQ